MLSVNWGKDEGWALILRYSVMGAALTTQERVSTGLELFSYSETINVRMGSVLWPILVD